MAPITTQIKLKCVTCFPKLSIYGSHLTFPTSSKLTLFSYFVLVQVNYFPITKYFLHFYSLSSVFTPYAYKQFKIFVMCIK